MQHLYDNYVFRLKFKGFWNLNPDYAISWKLQEI